jgi:membrane protein implicated in regulation of membrane protease activity
VDIQAAWCSVLAATERDDLEHFNELISSWPVQLALTAFYVGLAVLAFSRVARDWDDGARRWFRAVAVALGVFLVLDVVLGSAVLGLVIWPLWVQIPLVVWLGGMWLYYTMRFMTRVRPGPGDPETQRRGAALELVLDEAEADQHRQPGG